MLVRSITTTNMAALRNGVAAFSSNYFRLQRSTRIFQKRTTFIGTVEKDPPVKPRQFQVSRDPDEWKYVKRLLNRVTVPKYAEKPEYPSGWVPPKADAKNQPYFVERSKNHQLSVYLDNNDRGQCKITLIKRIHGDIWRLHDELKEYVEKKGEKRVSSQVLEANSVIKFKGDRYHWVEEFLLSKGF